MAFVDGNEPIISMDETTDCWFYGIIRTPVVLTQMVVQDLKNDMVLTTLIFRYPDGQKSVQKWGIEKVHANWEQFMEIFQKSVDMAKSIYGVEPEVVKKDCRELTHEQLIDWFKESDEFNIRTVDPSRSIEK